MRENKLIIPFDMSIDDAVDVLIERKKLGDDCYFIFNGIRLSNSDFNTHDEGLLLYKTAWYKDFKQCSEDEARIAALEDIENQKSKMKR